MNGSLIVHLRGRPSSTFTTHSLCGQAYYTEGTAIDCVYMTSYLNNTTCRACIDVVHHEIVLQEDLSEGRQHIMRDKSKLQEVKINGQVVGWVKLDAQASGIWIKKLYVLGMHGEFFDVNVVDEKPIEVEEPTEPGLYRLDSDNSLLTYVRNSDNEWFYITATGFVNPCSWSAITNTMRIGNRSRIEKI